MVDVVVVTLEFYVRTFSRSVKLDQVKKSRLKYIEWLIPIYIPLVS